MRQYGVSSRLPRYTGKASRPSLSYTTLWDTIQGALLALAKSPSSLRREYPSKHCA